jgi:hypothetical protein
VISRTRLSCLAAACIAGCTSVRTSLPLLHVSPEQLGSSRVLEQRLRIERNGQSHLIDASVEITPSAVRMVGSVMGMRVYGLDYDGRRIRNLPGPGMNGVLPPTLVVDDFLLVFAPAVSLQAALPPGWTLLSGSAGRQLLHDGTLVVDISGTELDATNGRTRLHNQFPGYDLTIDSVVAQ